MIITHHREKLLNAIIYFARNTRLCGKTKLLTLLYFLDFEHFKKTGRSVTGQDYFAWEMGPVPNTLFDELSGHMKPDMKKTIHELSANEDFRPILPKKKFDPQYFSKIEMDLIKRLAFIFKDAKANDMIEATHLRNKPWYRTLQTKGEFQQIDYMLAIDGSDDSLTHDEAKERMQDRLEMYAMFGVQ